MAIWEGKRGEFWDCVYYKQTSIFVCVPVQSSVTSVWALKSSTLQKNTVWNKHLCEINFSTSHDMTVLSRERRFFMIKIHNTYYLHIHVDRSTNRRCLFFIYVFVSDMKFLFLQFYQMVTSAVHWDTHFCWFPVRSCNGVKIRPYVFRAKPKQLSGNSMSPDVLHVSRWQHMLGQWNQSHLQWMKPDMNMIYTE